MSNANEPAYPQGHLDGPHVDPSGLTKRELFAAMLLQGVLSNGSLVNQQDEKYVRCAVQGADALLTELAKPTK